MKWEITVDALMVGEMHKLSTTLLYKSRVEHVQRVVHFNAQAEHTLNIYLNLQWPRERGGVASYCRQIQHFFI